MKTVDVLKQAREILTRGWTTGWFAKDAYGNPISEFADEACSWCAAGALYKAAGLGNTAAVYEAENALEAEINRSISGFNDAQMSVEPVLELFDKTIAKLEASS